MDGLDVLMRGRTAIMITHSPALARTADRVIETRDGRILRQGTPQELAADLRSIRAAAAAEASRDGLPRRASAGRRIAADEHAARSGCDGAGAAARARPRTRGSREWRIRYLRYKPRKSLVVHYDVTIDGGSFDAVATIAARRNVEAWAREPEYRRLAEMVDGRAPARSPLSYEAELQALIQWLPLDISMPALAQDQIQLRTHLQAAGVEIAVER